MTVENAADKGRATEIDWSKADRMDLPWYRDSDEMALRDVAASGELASSGQQRARAKPSLNRSLPWLRDANIDWSAEGRKDAWNISKRLLAYAHYANQFEDINTVVELMLSEARDATRADGGTFYLVTSDDRLQIAYFQNESMSNGKSDARNHYINVEMPISETSIAGFAALSRKLLNIPDVSEIPGGVPYAFNSSFDLSSGYKTVSMLTVPVVAGGGKPLAVLQLINSMDDNGVPKAFDDTEALYVELLAFQSTPYLTKSMMTRRLIEMMLRISEMRDPEETGAHVVRVGSMAAEIYERWALDHKIDREEMMREKDTLRLAAMLHDVGKLLIPDSIIKKPGKLTEEEYELMKTHCARGAEMYVNAESLLVQVAYEITLYHHQRWDGRGYTGDPAIPNRKGPAIPIYARITSVADVLDALASARSYKEAWSFEDAMSELERSAGTQFDPEIVSAALAIQDTLKAIIDRYK